MAQLIIKMKNNILPKKALAYIGLIVLLSSMFTGCYYDIDQELYGSICDTSVTSYSQYVKPLLDANCNGCHSGASPSGQIDLTAYEKVKVYADNGKLYGSVAQLTGYKPMPQGGKLSSCDIKKLKVWLDAGAQQN